MPPLFTAPILVLALGLWSLLLLLVKDGSVQIVKGCCRKKDGRKGTSARAEEWAPFRTAGEGGVDTEQNPPPGLSEGLLGPESPALARLHPCYASKRYVPTPPWSPVLWTKSPVPVKLQLAKRRRGNPRTRPPTLPDPQPPTDTHVASCCPGEMFTVVEFGYCYWLKWGQLPVPNVLLGASSLWVTAFAAQVRGHTRNKQHLSQTQAGLRQRAGLCPALSNPPVALRHQRCELVASAPWWVASAGVSFPGICWVFKPSARPVMWDKTTDFAKVGTRWEDSECFARPGWWPPHHVPGEVSVTQFR